MFEAIEKTAVGKVHLNSLDSAEQPSGLLSLFHPSLGSVVFESGKANQHAPAGHGSRVMVAALDFVPRIVFDAVVIVVIGAVDRQSFGQHAAGEHLVGRVVVVALHNRVAIS